MSSKPITRLAEVRATHNVVSAVRDAEAARGVIEALERHGVDTESISLLGSHDPRLRPLRSLVGRVGRVLVTGMAIGAVAGTVVGWLSSIGGDGALIWWAIVGAVAGSFVVAVSSFGMSRAWWRTFEAEAAGTLAVGVHTDDAAEAHLAARVLESARPMSTNRF